MRLWTFHIITIGLTNQLDPIYLLYLFAGCAARSLVPYGVGLQGTPCARSRAGSLVSLDYFSGRKRINAKLTAPSANFLAAEHFDRQPPPLSSSSWPVSMFSLFLCSCQAPMNPLPPLHHRMGCFGIIKERHHSDVRAPS
jgi:hypothetical protein